MKTCAAGDKLVCDFHFSGKPNAVCTQVLEPGNGRSASKGRVEARITKDAGSYKKGQVVELPAWMAVPVSCWKGPPPGGYFMRVDTNFEWK